MTKKASAARREYLKQWRKKNPERIRQYTETYWAKKADEMEKQGNDSGALTAPAPMAPGADHGGRAVDV